MESARSMMSHANLPNRFWAETVTTASYLRNGSVTTALEDGKTPYEKWYGGKPKLEHLRVFGCTTYAHVSNCIRKKLDAKAEKLRFIGYSKNTKGYQLYNEQTNKVITRRDITFGESNFLHSSEAKQHGETLEVLFPTDAPETTREAEIQEPDNAIQDQQVCRSGRAHDQPNHFGNWVSYTATCKHFVNNVCEVPETKTIDLALSNPHAKEW